MADALITNHTENWGPTARLFGVLQEHLGELFCHVN